MAPTLVVVSPAEISLGQFVKDYGAVEIQTLSDPNPRIPTTADGLFIYAPEESRLQVDVADIVESALNAGIPVLASALGMHPLNTAVGGDSPIDTALHNQKNSTDSKRTTIFLAPGAKVSSTIGGSGWLGVNCDHQKGISQAGLAQGMMASALSEDRIVEAFEMPGHHWVIGVQWDVFGALSLPRGFDAIWMAFMERVTGA